MVLLVPLQILREALLVKNTNNGERVYDKIKERR